MTYNSLINDSLQISLLNVIEHNELLFDALNNSFLDNSDIIINTLCYQNITPEELYEIIKNNYNIKYEYKNNTLIEIVTLN